MRWHDYLVVGISVLLGLASIVILVSDIAGTRPLEGAVPQARANPAND